MKQKGKVSPNLLNILEIWVPACKEGGMTAQNAQLACLFVL